MSVYDDVEFKSLYERKIQQIPIRDIKEDFKDDFIETFKNFRVDDVKNMLHLNPKEEIKFDFTFDKKENVTEDFFSSNKIFDENANVEDKIDFMVDFIQSSYDVLTPKVLRQIFEELLGISNSDMKECDYEMMIYQNFNKYQINLKNEKDKELFKNILKESLQDDIQEINNILPSVNKNAIEKEKEKEKIQISTKQNLKEKLSQNLILN